MVSKAKHDTIQGERVKSVEELMIANFLYLNGIEYEYEKPYPHGDIMYRPDFYLTDYDIYLEHFGVDEAYDWTGGFIERKAASTPATYLKVYNQWMRHFG